MEVKPSRIKGHKMASARAKRADDAQRKAHLKRSRSGGMSDSRVHSATYYYEQDPGTGGSNA